MKRLLAVVVLLGFLTRSAHAHRLDEYLQAAMFSFDPGTVHVTLRMIPGVAVASRVIAELDSNNDGSISIDEQQRYAEKVRKDLSLREDNQSLNLHLDSVAIPTTEQMQAGTGEIELAFSAALPAPYGQHVLRFENHYQPGISVYLVNSLVPADANLHLDEQIRSQDQAAYRVSFGEAGAGPLKTVTFSGFSGAFHLGMRHISEGTDHLLFLLTLLLPAPLLAVNGAWRRKATIRQSLVQSAGIVTAFTLGHSLTLGLCVLGVVQLPSRPVEVLIAASILISALHAAHPLFPGKESLIAGFFGLIHGLAFASALRELGVGGWYRMVSLLGFNTGIEGMQLIVIVVSLPALLLLSRTPFYSAFRLFGAALASIFSIAWMFERLSNRPNAVGKGAVALAQHGLLLGICLWLLALLAWAVARLHRSEATTSSAQPAADELFVQSK